MTKRTKEDLADFVRRTLNEKRLTTRDVEQRAKRKGKRITHGYVSRIVSRTATNLTVDRLKALAVGMGVREKEVFDRVTGEPIENDFDESDFALLHAKYKELSDEDKKEVRTLVRAIDREIEWRLKS